MRSHRPTILASAVTVAALSLLAAGCGGGGGSPGVANVSASTTTATTPQDAMVAFSRCMRSHGVPNFPDPQRLGGRSLKLAINQVGVANSRFPAAQRACNHLLPSGGGSQESDRPTRAQLAGELSFARCMRSHGLGRFPDPNAQGELTVEMVQGQGIDVHSPAVLRVVRACLPASHGWLTPAKVRQALAEARP